MSAGSSMRRGTKIGKDEVKMSKLNVIQRVDVLEIQLASLKEFLSKELAKIKNTLDLNSTVLNSVSAILGPDTIRSKMDELQAESLEAASARQAAIVAEKVSSGQMVQTMGPATDISFVVTTQTDTRGKVIPPSKLFLPLKNYPKEVGDALAGKSVGDSTVFDEHTITIVDMFDMVLPAIAPAPAGE